MRVNDRERRTAGSTAQRMMRKARAVNKVRMGEYLSASIFVATVTDEMVEVVRLHENGLNVLVILGSEAEIKHLRVISMMVGDAESHGGLVGFVGRDRC